MSLSCIACRNTMGRMLRCFREYRFFRMRLLRRTAKDFVLYHDRINNGRPRKHERQCEYGIKVHRSVKMRMEAEHLLKPYTPRLKFEVEPEWVD